MDMVAPVAPAAAEDEDGADYREAFELREALAFARTENLPLLLLGGGSNIVLNGTVHNLSTIDSEQGGLTLNVNQTLDEEGQNEK